MFGVNDTHKPDVQGVATEAEAHDQTKKEARQARLAAGGNPHEWKNMNKAQKAGLIIGALGTAFIGYTNPGVALEHQKTLFGKRTAFDLREEERAEIGRERKHELAKIKATGVEQVKVVEKGAELDLTAQTQGEEHQASQLDREWDYKATAQSNDFAFRGDQAMVQIFGEKMLQGIRIEAQEKLQGGAQAHQTSLAMLQARQEQVRTFETSLLTALGPGNELMVLDYIGRIEPYLVHGGELPSYTPELVEAMEQVASDTIYRRKLDIKSAQLDNLVNARQILAMASPKGEEIMDPSDPRFVFIQGVAGNVNSLASSEESSVASASLLATERGQTYLNHLATLFERPHVPGLTDIDVLVSEGANMEIPINPVVAREWLFQTGADPDVVDDRIPLPDSYLEPDPLDRTPEATVSKKLYGHYVEPALESADVLDSEFGRTLRLWHEKNSSGQYRQDYAQIWRIIKQYQTSDESLKASLMDYLAGGRKTVGYTGQLGKPTTFRR